jgi:hypothetical protein
MSASRPARDHHLIGEGFDQLDLLVGERLGLLPLDVDGADKFIFFKHWNGEDGPIITKFNGGYDKRILRDVRRYRSHVGDVAHLLRSGDTSQRGIGRGADEWIARSCLDKRKRCIVLCNETESASFVEVHRSEFGRTYPRRVLQDRLEHWLQFADQAVIAIENVRLFDEVQACTRELSESLEQQTATSEVLSVISSSPGELGPVFQAMLENATRICVMAITSFR